MALKTTNDFHARVFQTSVSGGGKTGARFRSMDWSKTTMGSLHTWPEELQISLDTLFHSRMPMVIWWGPDLILFYNDAYKQSLAKDKHETALGQKGAECWSELWPTLEPQLDIVFKRGQATCHKNQLFRISRDGKIENTYWSYGYSPIFLRDGSVGGALAIVNETTELVRAEQIIASEREKLHSLFMQAPIPICTLEGPEHTFTLANPPYIELSGRCVLGKTVREVYSEEEAGKFFEILDGVYETGKPFIGTEIMVKHPGGEEERYINIGYHPFRSPNGKIQGITALLQNVTEQVNARRIVQMAKESAEAANEAKTFFLANMSHEIRTPLSAIIGFTELLKSSNVSAEERQKYLNIITRNGQALSSIIDDVLDLSKIEAGKIEINREPLNFTELVTDVLEMFSDKAGGKGLNIQLESSRLPNFNIISDPLRLRQILVNLIGNAVKFTSQGSIVVHGNFEMLGENDLRMSISITDTGKGLSREEAEKLFKPFAQADGKSARQYGGTGLGLALSRKLARALGGNVSLANSEQSKGCTFNIEFVATKSAEVSDDGPLKKTEQSRRLKGLKVLVVDDSPDNRHLIKLLLVREGAMVEQANGGEQAIELALDDSYDAILMDIQMPGIDGYETLTRLRRENFKTPVFALTAYAMKEDRDRALKCGFSGHISKPINANHLVETLLSNTRRLH